MAGLVLPLLLLLQSCAALDLDLDPDKLQGLSRARVEVKAFVVEDIPLYHNLVMKHIPGADPELVLLNHFYEELERIPLSDMTRTEINSLLQTLGFYKKQHEEEEVPEEFRFSPAKSSPFPEEPAASPTPSPSPSPSPEPESKPEHTDL